MKNSLLFLALAILSIQVVASVNATAEQPKSLICSDPTISPYKIEIGTGSQVTKFSVTARWTSNGVARSSFGYCNGEFISNLACSFTDKPYSDSALNGTVVTGQNGGQVINAGVAVYDARLRGSQDPMVYIPCIDPDAQNGDSPQMDLPFPE